MKRLILIMVILLIAYPVMAQLGNHALLKLFPHTYNDLTMKDMPNMIPNLPDGQITYCSDCAVPASPGTKCAAGGPGAEAHLIRGQWLCF